VAVDRKMPKKIGSNPKALEARARKEEKKRLEHEAVSKAKEDALWTDDDKHVNRKLQRKDDRERKKQEEQEKRLLNKQLYEQEMAEEKTAKPTKVTRTQIAAILESEKTAKVKKSDSESSLEENTNVAPVEQVSARGIDQALAALGLVARFGRLRSLSYFNNFINFFSINYWIFFCLRIQCQGRTGTGQTSGEAHESGLSCLRRRSTEAIEARKSVSSLITNETDNSQRLA
jgi:hypothetical protein